MQQQQQGMETRKIQNGDSKISEWRPQSQILEQQQQQQHNHSTVISSSSEMKSTTTSVDIPIEERQPGESAVRGASINASIPFVPINEGKI